MYWVACDVQQDSARSTGASWLICHVVPKINHFRMPSSGHLILPSIFQICDKFLHPNALSSDRTFGDHIFLFPLLSPLVALVVSCEEHLERTKPRAISGSATNPFMSGGVQNFAPLSRVHHQAFRGDNWGYSVVDQQCTCWTWYDRKVKQLINQYGWVIW